MEGKEALTVQALIRRFEDRLRRMDDASGDRPAGNGPRFPMLTVCLGRNAETVRRNLCDRLMNLWPQYRGELRFLRAEPDGASHKEPDGTPDDIPDGASHPVRCYGEDGTPLNGDGLRGIVSDLFRADTHFADYDALLLCVALDTGGVTDADGFVRLLDAARAVRRETHGENVRELWAVLLDESHGRERISGEIRRILAGLSDEPKPPALLLLTNRRSDGRLDEGWTLCCGAAADAFAVFNSDAGGDLLRAETYTAAWNRVEKPYGDISQICACALLDRLSVQTDLPGEEELRMRLGLTRENTFQFLDTADRAAYLPRTEQLGLFPLPAPRRADWASPQTAAREFDERTLGAWSCWLDCAWEAMSADGPDPAARGREYAALLRDQFSLGELASLGERRDGVERWFRSAQPPSGDLPLFSYAESYWKYRASSDPAVLSALLDALDDLAAEGRAFVSAFRTLDRSRSTLHRTGDEDLSRFYGDLLRDYFDGCGDALGREFRTLGGLWELDGFLERAMEGILQDGRMRKLASFGEELAVRLKTAAKSAETSREVLRKLSGDALPVYFTAKFNLGHPVRAFLLLRTAGPLYEDLLAELPGETCFYDTGGGASVEALTLYRVERGQLM